MHLRQHSFTLGQASWTSLNAFIVDSRVLDLLVRRNFVLTIHTEAYLQGRFLRKVAVQKISIDMDSTVYLLHSKSRS